MDSDSERALRPKEHRRSDVARDSSSKERSSSPSSADVSLEDKASTNGSDTLESYPPPSSTSDDSRSSAVCHRRRREKLQFACLQFARNGVCSYGENCKFSHDPNATNYRNFYKTNRRRNYYYRNRDVDILENNFNHMQMNANRHGNRFMNQARASTPHQIVASPGKLYFMEVSSGSDDHSSVTTLRPVQPVYPPQTARVSTYAMEIQSPLRQSYQPVSRAHHNTHGHDRGRFRYDNTGMRDNARFSDSRRQPFLTPPHRRQNTISQQMPRPATLHRFGNQTLRHSDDRNEDAVNKENTYRFANAGDVHCRRSGRGYKSPPVSSRIEPTRQVVIPTENDSVMKSPEMERIERWQQFDSTDHFYRDLSTEANVLLRQIDVQVAMDQANHDEAIQFLQKSVGEIWSDATIQIYGSEYTKLSLPQSDIDCVVMGESIDDASPVGLLRALRDQVCGHAQVKRVTLLAGAKIPVAKIVFSSQDDDRFGTSEVLLDVTCSNTSGHSGLQARELVRMYVKSMPALRPLALILKQHLHNCGLNNSYTGGLSSYCLVLMIIRFLQAFGDRHYHLSADEDTMSDKASSEISCGETSSQHQSSSGSVDVAPKHGNHEVYVFVREHHAHFQASLGYLLMLFLETYATFDYQHFGISILDGGEYFPLDSMRFQTHQRVVMIPSIADPIIPERVIGNSFKMDQVVQAWLDLYHQLMNGLPLLASISMDSCEPRDGHR